MSTYFLLVALVEKVLFVVRWAHTRQAAVLESLRQIVDSQGDVAGVVLSRVSSRQQGQHSHRHAFHKHSVSPATDCPLSH